MNLSIIGYGKLGQKIDELSTRFPEMDVLHKINSKNKEIVSTQAFKKTDVAIELSGPENARNNLLLCAKNKITTVCGSTGWLEHWDEVVAAFNANETGFLYASNFSIGMNVFFEVNKFLAEKLGHLGYQVSIEEIHHIQKKDAPSGTAITLANQIIDLHPSYSQWILNENKIENIRIDAHRKEDVKGIHDVRFENELDKIVISHKAKGREAFALGALKAAQWMNGKTGIFSMSDVLNN